MAEPDPEMYETTKKEVTTCPSCGACLVCGRKPPYEKPRKDRWWEYWPTVTWTNSTVGDSCNAD